MKRKDLTKLINDVATDNNIPREQVIEAFKQALISGCKKDGQVKTCRIELNEEKGELNLYKQRIVVGEYNLNRDSMDPATAKMTQISVIEAKKIKPRIKIGDILEEEVNPTNFSYSSARIVKNSFRDGILKAQKDALYNYFKERENTVIKGRVISMEQDGQCMLDIGHEVTTLLPKKDILPNDRLHVNAVVSVLITSVDKEREKHLVVYVSRTKNEVVTSLLTETVPEIKDGIVEIKAIAREAGDRSKVGVISYDPNVDPIGACIGEAKLRIRDVQNALRGEKIDLFKWSDDIPTLITNALQPADVIKVFDINTVEKKARAIVPDDQLSLAIGNKGQNVQLAVRATGWNIDIKSVSEAKDLNIELTSEDLKKIKESTPKIND